MVYILIDVLIYTFNPIQDGGGAKKPPYSPSTRFSPVTYTNVGTGPKTF